MDNANIDKPLNVDGELNASSLSANIYNMIYPVGTVVNMPSPPAVGSWQCIGAVGSFTRNAAMGVPCGAMYR